MAGACRSVTVLGTGCMGLAVCRALSKAGLRVTPWNRTARHGTIAELSQICLTFERDLAQAVAAGNMIVSCLLDCDTLLRVIERLPQHQPLRGKTVLNFSTGTPKNIGRLMDLVRSLGCESYFDGAIMNAPGQVGTKHCHMHICGGSQRYFAKVEEIILAIGQANYLGPDPLAARIYDNASLAVMYSVFSGMFTAMGLLKKHPRIDTSLEAAVARHLSPFLKSLVPYMESLARTWDENKFDLEDPVAIGMQMRALETVLQTCAEEDVDSGGLKQFLEILTRAARLHGRRCSIAASGVVMARL